MTKSKRYHVRECFSNKQFTIAERSDRMFNLFIWDPEDCFYGCIGSYETLEEAEKRMNEAVRVNEEHVFKIVDNDGNDVEWMTYMSVAGI